ncbi:FAD-binding oxidoreductase [Microbacterium sp. SORGH_AS_0888]|uniref:NAD(P)/FAD-dependent oxidoreductase n=1 Tax=Microbacterium sp. SORGH_AS_0888 TaxID=3041791 RepID=UPI002780D475|nr:FAD-dependent oxidoreductase [Microbacterium sp. SORGH_AS_0888]MDQ1130507.1 glycine/D-amino acid oxidase-like deaminating enzyme [Microbacterium sp. SORGH_AS_0888]
MGTTVFERHAPAASAVDHALAGSRHAVFWLDGLARPERPRLRGEVDADLVVVGGGYTGLWTALRAKERDPGRRVVVLEARTVGWAASGRNGGFCEASLTHGHENGIRRWPEELDELERLGRANLDAIGDTIARYGMDAEFERTGTLSVAVEPHQIAWLSDEEGFLDADATRALVNSPTYLAGAWEREDTALVHPAKLAAELARVAEELGVEIFEHSRVARLDEGGVHTEHGAVRAAQVALATNVFPSLLRRNRLMTVPVYDYVLMTEPLTAAQHAEIGWEGRQGVADLANQFHYYRPTADGRILFGGYDAVYHPGGRVRARYEDRPASFRTLAAHFLTTFPQLEGIRFTHRWAGAIDSCSRFCAFFGTARGGRVAYAAGFTGLGVGASRFGADTMLDLLSGERTERTALRMVHERPVPFPPEPAASVGVNLVRWSMDRADHAEGRRNALLRTLDALGMGFDS